MPNMDGCPSAEEAECPRSLSSPRVLQDLLATSQDQSPHTASSLLQRRCLCGLCQQGDVVELAATDPQLGAVFYTMDQDPESPPKILRDRGQCLTCHATARTQSVPGYLVRSVYPDINGRPRTGTRTYVTDHSSPFEQRWGGWYVTGTHGDARHLGNIRSNDRNDPRKDGCRVGCQPPERSRKSLTSNLI